MTTENPALGPIVRVFAIAQVVAILIPFVVQLFGIETGSGVNLALSFAAAMVAAQSFVKTYGRAPTSEERRSLAWLSLATSCGISLALMGLFAALGGPEAVSFFKQILQAVPNVVFGIIVILVCGLYLGVYQVAYGPVAQRLEKKIAAAKRP